MKVQKHTVEVKDLTAGDVVRHRMYRSVETLMVGRVAPSSTGNTAEVEMFRVTPGQSPTNDDSRGWAWLRMSTKMQKLDACWNCADGRECGVCGRNMEQAEATR